MTKESEKRRKVFCFSFSSLYSEELEDEEGLMSKHGYMKVLLVPAILSERELGGRKDGGMAINIRLGQE